MERIDGNAFERAKYKAENRSTYATTLEDLIGTFGFFQDAGDLVVTKNSSVRQDDDFDINF
jgi:hypothetical protein